MALHKSERAFGTSMFRKTRSQLRCFDLGRLGLGGRCSPLFVAFQLFLSVRVAASGTFPGPDRSAEVWSVSVVFCRCSSRRAPRFIERDPPILFVSKVLIFRCSIGGIFLRVLVHLDADFFSSINADLRFTKYGIFLEAIVNPFKSSLDASPP